MQMRGEFRSVYDGTLVTIFIKARLQNLLAYLLIYHASYLSPKYLSFLLLPDSPNFQANAYQIHLKQYLRRYSQQQTNLYTSKPRLSIGKLIQPIRWTIQALRRANGVGISCQHHAYGIFILRFDFKV